MIGGQAGRGRTINVRTHVGYLLIRCICMCQRGVHACVDATREEGDSTDSGRPGSNTSQLAGEKERARRQQAGQLSRRTCVHKPESSVMALATLPAS